MDSVKKQLRSFDERAKVALTPKTKLSLPLKDKRLEELLLWRDPSKSTLVLVGISGAFFLLNTIAASPVTVLANIAQLAVIVCFFYNVAATFLKRPGVPVPRFVAQGVSEAEAKDVAARCTVYINKALAIVERIIRGKDFVLSLQVASSLFVLSKVASVVSPLTLTWLGVLALFTLPKLYEMKKAEIDSTVGKARQQYSTVYDKHIDPLWKKIPRASTATSSSANSTPLKTPAATGKADLANQVQSMMEETGGKKLF